MGVPAEMERRLGEALSGEGLRGLLRQAPAAIFVKDLDGRYRFVNAAWTAISGIPEDRALGLGDDEVFGAAVGAAFRENDRQVLEHGVPLDVEEGGEFRGVSRTYRSLKFPLRDAAGEVVGVGGISVEITGSRRVEEALRESEERLARALHGAPWPVMVHDLDGRVLLVNQAWLDSAGVGREQIPTVERWLQLAHGEGWPQMMAVIRDILTHGRVGASAECEVRTPRGSRIWSFFASHIGPLSGRPAMVTMALDVTERRRAEAELRRREEELARVFTTSPDLLGIASFDGPHLKINPAYTAVLGFSEAEILGRSVLECIVPEDREAAAEAIRTMEHGASLSRFVIRCLHRDGGFRWIAWNGSPVPGTRMFVVVGRDVTEERARAEFERQLIGIVSHDLKNPLAAIHLAASALLRRGDALDERTLRAAGRIQSSADAALKLTRDLLDFTRARLGGGIPVRPEPVDLHRLVREAVDEVLAGFPDREVRVAHDGSGAGEWDPGRLAQVVKNLLGNALRYGREDGAVKVCSRGRDGEVELDVWNEGAPIPAEELPHLFEPMRRGRSTATGGGVGLGLFIVDTLVRAHGGRVTATSSAEGGTRFVVRLPRRPPPA